MRFDIITIFPHIFDSYFNTSIIGRAFKKGLIEIKVHNLRKWAGDKHKTVDDRPYGGGPGMIIKADVIYQSLKSVQGKNSGKVKTNKKQKIVLLSPSGKQFNQKMAQRYSRLERIIFICGHYEGVDARVEKFVDEKISIGPYILTGGELPVMAMIDAITRLIPGVIRPESLKEESFSLDKAVLLRPAKAGLRRTLNFVSSLSRSAPCASDKIGEYPQYTRPETLMVKSKSSKLEKMKVPKVLLSGNHKKIGEWKLKHTIKQSDIFNQ